MHHDLSRKLYFNPEEDQKTRYHSVRDRVVWMLLLDGPDQSMTLLPDSWGPREGCPACGAAWSHVTHLGTLAGGGIGTLLTLEQHRTTEDLYARLTLATCRTSLAKIQCTEGHGAVVYSDGLVEMARPVWGAGVPWEVHWDDSSLGVAAAALAMASYGIYIATRAQ